VFTFAERHKMINVCRDGRGGETSMLLRITEEGGSEEVAFSLRVVLGPTRIRIELTTLADGVITSEESHLNRGRLFDSVIAQMSLHERDKAQLLEQLTQFVNRHVGPAFISSEI
jgi:hypothetical protein